MERGGERLRKSETTSSVVNILLPRYLWHSVQSLRTLYSSGVYCGPHITFVEPFVVEEELEEATNILKESFRKKPFKTFTIHLRHFSYFQHSRAATLFLVPEFETEDGETESPLEELMEHFLSVFPQCDDHISRNEGHLYIPHVSIGRFRTLDECLLVKQKLEKEWKGVSFEMKELDILSRKMGDSFQVYDSVSISHSYSIPSYFGPNSSHLSPTTKSLVLLGFPPKKLTPNGVTNGDVMKMFKKILGDETNYPKKVEVILNPNGKPSNCAVVEFGTSKKMLHAIHSFNPWCFNWDGYYVVPLTKMAFPDVVCGSTCLPLCKIRSFLSTDVLFELMSQHGFDHTTKYDELEEDTRNLLVSELVEKIKQEIVADRFWGNFNERQQKRTLFMLNLEAKKFISENLNK